MNFTNTIKSKVNLKNRNDLFFIFLSFFVFALPLYKISSSPGLIVLSIAILVKLFQSKFQILKELVKSKISILFLVLYALVFISFFYSTNVNNGIKEVKNLLPLLIFPLLFTFVKLKESQIIFILKSFITGCLVAFFISVGSQFFHYINGQEYSFHYSNFVAILWMHPTYLAIYLNFSIIVVYHLLVKKEISFSYFAFSISIFLVFILLLSARMQIINSILVFVLIFVHFLKNHFSVKTFISLLLLPVIMITFILNNQKIVDRFTYVQNMNYNLESTKNTSWNGANVRLAIWDCAFDVIKDNLIFGVGVGDEDEELLKSFKNRNFNFAYNLNYVAHNQYVQFLISNGVIGLLSYLSIFIYCFYYALKNKHFLLFGLTMLLLISGFSESFLKMQSGIVFFSFMILLLFQYKTFQKD
jgi:O-antigen ligase